MKLLLDIGNSRVKWASAHKTSLRGCGHSDYAPGQLEDILQQVQTVEAPGAIYVSSVIGAQAEDRVTAWALECWGLQPVFVRSQASACGVQNAYDQAEKLGVDRWLAVIAAHHRGAGPACVVDAGTALTVDAVSADGLHRGGLITPGVTSMRLILDERTQLSLPKGQGAADQLGNNTDDAIASGTLQSILALVEQAYQRMATEWDAPPRALITGGEAECLHANLRAGWTLAPHLVLEGLARVAVAMEE